MAQGEKLSFSFDQANLELGIVNTTVAVIEGISIPQEAPPKLTALCESSLQRAHRYTPEQLASQFEGYYKLYRALGYNPKKIRPAPESLVTLIRKRDRFPRINAAVDAYNTVVVETLLGIGAHDLDRVQGPIAFTRATGQERFIPLADRKSVIPAPGDFLYRDSQKVLAHLASEDCDEAKLTLETHNILLVLEGHPNTTPDDTYQAVEEACRRITEFCGGSVTLLKQLPEKEKLVDQRLYP